VCLRINAYVASVASLLECSADKTTETNLPRVNVNWTGICKNNTRRA